MGRNIILYTMHGSEHEIADRVFKKSRSVEGFRMGSIDEKGLQELVKGGLVFRELKKDRFAGKSTTDIMKHIRKSKSKIKLPDTPIIKFRGGSDKNVKKQGRIKFPAHFILFFSHPLLKENRQTLKKLKVNILQRLPEDAYLAKLERDVRGKLRKLGFMAGIKYYSAQDTGIDEVSKRSPGVDLTPQTREMLTYDVILHSAREVPAMLSAMKKKSIVVIGSSRNKIRVSVERDSPGLKKVADDERVRSIEEFIAPRLYNDLSRKTLGFESGIPVTVHIPYTGKGQIVGVADTGLDDSHPDFKSNVVDIVPLGRPGNYSDPVGHGTHVAGSIAGTGAASRKEIRGTAPDAKIFFQSVLDANGRLGGLPLNLSDLFEQAYKSGARIHNNSWGSATASRYTINSEEVDDFVYNHKDMLVVIAAGNEGDGSDPKYVPKGNPDLLSIGSPASCKNALTVGASRSSRKKGGFSQLTHALAFSPLFPFAPIAKAKVSGDANCLAGFSSRGPCDDYRIKPDVVAPGTDIASAMSSQAPMRKFWGQHPVHRGYAFMGGTSMATPLVTGCAAVVREYFEKEHNHQASAALLKATLINGCQPLSGKDTLVSHKLTPNYDQGFGMISMQHTIPNKRIPIKLAFFDNWQDPKTQFKVSGDQIRLRIQLQKAGWLSLCLAYTDPPARALQNNLNLILDNKGETQKWLGNETARQDLKMVDAINNVEVIKVKTARAGSYTAAITASNLLRGPQDFALVITSNQDFQMYKV